MLKLEKLRGKIIFLHIFVKKKLIWNFAQNDSIYSSSADILQPCSYKFCLNIHLGRYVIRRAAESLGSFVTSDAFLAHAEVRDFYVTVLIQQDIVKLEVTVDNAARVQVEQADCYLRRVESVNVESNT